MKERIKTFFIKYRKTIAYTLAFIVPIIIIFCTFSMDASAFGDHNDYDYDSDSGSYSGGDSYGGVDMDGEGFLAVLEILFYLFKVVYELFGLPGVCCLATIIVIGCVLFGVIKAKKSRDRDKYSSPQYKGYVAGTVQETEWGNNTTGNGTYNANNGNRVVNNNTNLSKPDRTVEIAGIIKERDVNFTDNDFIAYAKEVYTDVQYASCERNYYPVQAVVHSDFYDKRNEIAERHIAEGIVPHIDRLAVENGYLTSYRRDKEFEYIEMILESSLIDYQVKEDTGALINGDMSKRNKKIYSITFMRDKKAKTPDSGSASRAFNCPQCGGTMNNAANFGICPYCGSSVKSGEYGWVLYDMRIAISSSLDNGIVIED